MTVDTSVQFWNDIRQNTTRTLKKTYIELLRIRMEKYTWMKHKLKMKSINQYPMEDPAWKMKSIPTLISKYESKLI